MNLDHEEVVERLVDYLKAHGSLSPRRALNIFRESSKEVLLEDMQTDVIGTHGGPLYGKEAAEYVDDNWSEVASDARERLLNEMSGDDG